MYSYVPRDVFKDEKTVNNFSLKSYVLSLNKIQSVNISVTFFILYL